MVRETEEKTGCGVPVLTGDMVEALIRAYRPLVYAAARKMHPQAPLDEDLLQCGMIGLWKAAERWDQVRPFSPLARHCVRSEMAEHLRLIRGRLPTVSLEEVSRRELGDALQYREDFDGPITRDEICRTFPAGSRERALLLALADGVSMARAARQLGLTRPRALRMARRAWERVNSPNR